MEANFNCPYCKKASIILPTKDEPVNYNTLCRCPDCGELIALAVEYTIMCKAVPIDIKPIAGQKEKPTPKKHRKVESDGQLYIIEKPTKEFDKNVNGTIWKMKLSNGTTVNLRQAASIAEITEAAMLYRITRRDRWRNALRKKGSW